jgi:hypothetical protein
MGDPPRLARILDRAQMIEQCPKPRLCAKRDVGIKQVVGKHHGRRLRIGDAEENQNAPNSDTLVNPGFRVLRMTPGDCRASIFRYSRV